MLKATVSDDFIFVMAPAEAVGFQSRLKRLNPFGISNNRTKWDLRLDIPSSVFSLDTFSGLKARGNFYKCADASPARHYMSLYPIHTPKPDFHRPEFFDDLIFE